MARSRLVLEPDGGICNEFIMKALAMNNKYVYHKHIRFIISTIQEGISHVAKQNILELNGKRYDAVTGELLVSSVPTKQHSNQTSKKPVSSSSHGPQFVDGFVRPGRLKAAPLAATERVQYVQNRPLQAAAPIAQPKALKAKAPAAPIKAHKPEQSKTLMRTVVKKPEPSLKRTTKVLTRTDILAKAPSTYIAPKVSLRTIDAEREKRAKRIAKHHLISRFHQVKPSASLAAALKAQSPSQPVVQAVPVPRVHTLQTAPAPVRAKNPADDVFQRALERATSHEQAPVKITPTKKARKLPRLILSAGSLAIAVLLLGGFFAYQNQAQLTLKMASSRAGFTASLPNYQPTGFHIGHFEYSPGTVAVNYNGKDNHTFQVLQKLTNWDSEALLDNYVIANAKNYQEVQAAGRTIYLYNNTATWVNNGVWYQVNGNGALGNNQLVELANSI